MKTPKPMPAADDPLYYRTCNRCHAVYRWVDAPCPKCGEVEFTVRKEAIESNDE